jgi:CubicO group peptidase (beta-lactamase class C family)
VLALSVAAAGESSPAQVRAILVERIDKQAQSVGIAVGLIDDKGSTVVTYGKVSKTDDRMPDRKTVFEIGSISKVFTSILLADMVLREKLSLDDPVQKFLPDTVRVPSRDDADHPGPLSTHTRALACPTTSHPPTRLIRTRTTPSSRCTSSSRASS